MFLGFFIWLTFIILLSVGSACYLISYKHQKNNEHTMRKTVIELTVFLLILIIIFCLIMAVHSRLAYMGTNIRHPVIIHNMVW